MNPWMAPSPNPRPGPSRWCYIVRKHKNAEGKGHVCAMICHILDGQINMIALRSHNQAIDLVCTPGRGLPDLHLDPTLVSQNHTKAI